MYTIHFSYMLRQLLPPPWRSGWRLRLVHTLLLPAEQLISNYAQRRRPQLELTHTNMQVFALQSRLSSIMGKAVVIEHRGEPFTFYVRVPELPSTATAAQRAEEAAKRRALQAYLSRNKLAGTSYEIEDY